jgi:micrococcal nuclease
MRRVFFLFAAAVILSYAAGLYTHPPSSQEEYVTVAKVIDGDTVELTDGRRVRYEQINAPETNEEFGSGARELNDTLVYGKSVRLEAGSETLDIYGRTLGFVWLADGRMVNELMVAEGYAQVVAYYGRKSKYYDILKSAQEEAKEESRGMWSD